MSKWAPMARLAACAVAGMCVFAAEPPRHVTTGHAAFVDYTALKPGAWRKIVAADLPKPGATASAGNGPNLVPRPEGAWPQAPAGFTVELYATDLENPRAMRTAPNGDLFVVESGKGDVKVYRGVTAKGTSEKSEVFASGLRQPFGVAFYPPGPNPQWVYIGNTNSVVRYPYQVGDMQARGASETVTTEIPAGGGHWTRDIAFSLDAKRMFVSVGSRSNVDDVDTHPAEKHRASILEFTPEGKFVKVYASGIRNAVGIAVHPKTGELWCSVNERDLLGDNLVPDYITHVEEDGFYGWPWFYIGANQDPHHAGKHPELKTEVRVPDVLLQPHNASLQMLFYDGAQFPAEYSGEIFAAEHGSWNRKIRTGYEVIRVAMKDGRATGEYMDFLTGFVTASGDVWGRPVGVAVARDGSLFVSDDGGNVIWRVRYNK